MLLGGEDGVPYEVCDHANLRHRRQLKPELEPDNVGAEYQGMMISSVRQFRCSCMPTFSVNTSWLRTPSPLLPGPLRAFPSGHFDDASIQAAHAYANSAKYPGVGGGICTNPKSK